MYMQDFSKNRKTNIFLPHDTQASGSKKCEYFGKFCVDTKCMLSIGACLVRFQSSFKSIFVEYSISIPPENKDFLTFSGCTDMDHSAKMD